MTKYKSYAKINLSLEVIEKRPDGYHEIDTLMNKIDLYDEISFKERSDNKIIIKSNAEDLPLDKSNLIYKAWDILSPYKEGPCGIEIHVDKNIPIAAGLGGGTSNGVLTMKVLNSMWSLGFNRDKLIEMSKTLGADSTFFYYDGLVRARGIGDRIEHCSCLKKYPLVLVNIGKPLSSKKVYEKMKNFTSGKVEAFVKAFKDNKEPWNLAYNNMEEVSFSIYPELEEIKEKIKETGAKISLMSGAGPSIFGLYDDISTRDRAYDLLKDKYKIVEKTRMV